MSLDDIKDITVKIVGDLVLEGLIPDCTDTNDDTEFDFQDSIVETLCKHYNVQND